MNKFFRATCISVLGLGAASGGFLACSSTDNTTNDGGTGDGGGGDGNPANGDGSVGEGGGDGGTAALVVGSIHLDQGNFMGNYTYSATASFTRTALSTVTPPPCPGMVSVTMGACLASVLCVPPASDAGMVTIPDTLDVGTITIAGGTGDAGAAVLTYGPITAGPYMYKGYKSVSGDLQFYAGGDMLTATAAGGADLPAIPSQTLIAPTDITITSPACTFSSCPAVDRTVDLVATWTGGGAGKVFFTYETLSATLVTIVSCNFDAAAGTGTVPAALLAHLEKAGDPGISGVLGIGVTNESPVIMVKDIPTKFEIQGGGTSGALTISK